MTVIFWIGFIVIIGGLLALDLGVFHKEDAEPSARSALRWTLVWATLALIFTGFVYGAYSHHWFGIGLAADGHVATRGGEAALQYLTGYLIEYTLSMDNIFVIALIFGFFQIPPRFQHRVLFWGIMGAIVMRGVMILAGAALVTRFSWIMYVFGAFLIFTAIKMLFSGDEKVDPEHSWVIKLTKKFFPVTHELDGNHFFTKLESGKWAATPLLLALVFIENTDLLFAVDSIPAIFAITTDPFIVFTSNIFAIMGLRSLYFALQAMLNRFHLLKYSLVFILAYVGVKMLIVYFGIHIPALASLGVIAAALGAGVLASLWATRDQASAI
ncbi:MAG: Inner membrane protein alx [Deltaproteobacteria bacterium ADurb.Bin510]|nr:MAG: Inner membrane protein alx [Deltaproteobacteria bacterium ADurb.Bin510]